MSTTRRDSIMLVKLNISQWTARKLDKGATLEVEQNHGTKDVGRFNKILLDPARIKHISSAAGDIRTYFYKHTLPWGDDESRVLTAALYPEFSREIQALISRFEYRVEELLIDYSYEVDQARDRLKTLFKSSDYPTLKELRSRYKAVWSVTPVPDAKDFRLDLGDAEVSRIQQEIEARVTEATKSAVTEIWDRMRDVIGRAQERLSTPDAIFRDSLIENIRELCDLIPKLNFTNDPKLEELRYMAVTQLATFNPQTLRDNQHARKQAADAATTMLDTMSSYLAGAGL